VKGGEADVTSPSFLSFNALKQHISLNENFWKGEWGCKRNPQLHTLLHFDFLGLDCYTKI
jgi:hypothetical protein